MSLADDQPLATSEAEFASIEAEFQAIGQPGGVLLAAVNRAALLGRLGRLAEAWALLQAARQQLQGQGDRLGALEVSLAMAELALTMGDEPEARKWLDAVADAQCPPRLRIRRMLLETRLHVRRLELGKAAAVLATLAEQDIASAAERFGIALATCELATLQLDPSVPARLAELQQASALSPREATAVRAAIAADAFWRGDLQTAGTLALAAAAEWRERGEPLPCIQALALAWRAQRLCGEPVLHADILSAVEVARTAGARDTQTGLELLAATVGPPAPGPATPDHRCETAVFSFIATLRTSGHEAAALVGVLVAASSNDDAMLHRYASDWLAASEAVAPVWWRQAGVVEEEGALE
jgi:tetratricopeptide (TPR) repeat protein